MEKPHSSLLRNLNALFGGNHAFAILIGKKIQSIFINSEKTLLSFVTDSGVFSFEAYGDCCSNSWFEHFENVQALIGNSIIDGEETTLGDIQGEWETIQIYSISLKTEKGQAKLEMRNSSNGYYGGEVRDSDINTNEKLITEDF